MSKKFKIQKSSILRKVKRKKMDPAYIYFKGIDIDQNETFTANFSKINK